MNGYGDVESAEDEVWSTREELLLVCAVNRHGTNNWDSVATELKSRTLSSFVIRPQTCKRRYHALQRRFAPEEREVDADLLLEKLRRIRVDELRREVENCDVSITSLQHKVKQLEEDRERSTGDEKYCGGRSDPSQKEKKANGTANQDDSGQSSNESNSEAKILDEEQEITHQPELGESGESVAETKGETVKENSDVQSSGNVSRRRRGRRKSVRGRGEEASNGHSLSLAESQPLVSLLEVFRSHEHGPVFERRLKIQEGARYRSLIRQHVDLASVQRKLMEGRYGAEAEFYRDLLLLCTNAVTFFPKTSTEYLAAVELRPLVRRQITGIPNPSSSSSSPHPPVLLETPLMACRKSEKEICLDEAGERVVMATTRKRRTAKARGAVGKSAKRRDGGTLLESLKNSKKELRAYDSSSAAVPVKRGVGRPPKRPPSGLLTPPPAKRTKVAPPQAKRRKS